MAKARIWNLRLNLDEINAAFIWLRSTQDHSDFLQGFMAGANGAPSTENPAPCWARGYAIGASTRDEAEAYRDRMRVLGKKGGNPNLTVNRAVKRVVNREDNRVDNQTDNQTDNPIHNPQSTHAKSPGHGWDE